MVPLKTAIKGLGAGNLLIEIASQFVQTGQRMHKRSTYRDSYLLTTEHQYSELAQLLTMLDLSIERGDAASQIKLVQALLDLAEGNSQQAQRALDLCRAL